MLLQADSQQPVFPAPFQCYKPGHHKVYGSVLMSTTNRLLLVKGRRTGKWSFPKGHKLRSEGYLECAMRETAEETGLDLRGRRPISCHKLSVGEYYFFEMEEELTPFVRDGAEVEEAGWFALDELKKMSCNVDVNYFIERVLRKCRGGNKRPRQEEVDLGSC
jgi:8-oxo-dGTP pyrophosphatase MutT (NUDIX family)